MFLSPEYRAARRKMNPRRAAFIQQVNGAGAVPRPPVAPAAPQMLGALAQMAQPQPTRRQQMVARLQAQTLPTAPPQFVPPAPLYPNPPAVAGGMPATGLNPAALTRRPLAQPALAPPLPPNALQPTQPAALAPQLAPQAQAMGAQPNLYPPNGGQRGPGAAGIRRRLMQQEYQNANRANPLLWDAFQRLQSEAGQDWTGYFAERAAPQLDELDRYFNRSEGELTRRMADRGLGDSSAMAAGMGALSAGRAQAHSGLVNDITQQATQRRDMLGGLLRDLLMNVQGRSSSQAGNLAGAIRQEQMQREAMSQGGGFDIGGILGGLGSLAGTIYGAGQTRRLIDLLGRK
jgi:hypothetical protein